MEDRKATGYVYEPFAETQEYQDVNRAIVRGWVDTMIAAGTRQVRSLIDVACGVGTMACLFLENAPAAWGRPQVTLVDMSGEAIEQATPRVQPLASGLHSICGRIQDVELPGAQFDVALWGNGIHYLDEDEQERALAALRHAMRPGGWLLFNSAFTAESRPADTIPFYRAQIARAARYLQSMGIRRRRTETRPNSSRFLPQAHYADLLTRVGFSVHEISSVAARLYQTAWEHISGFAQYAAGALHGYAEEAASSAMRLAVAPAIEQYGERDKENRPYVTRNWLSAIARVTGAGETTAELT